MQRTNFIFAHALMNSGRMLIWEKSLVAGAVAIPWLWPWAAGPSPQIGPWLISLSCLAVVFFFDDSSGFYAILGGWFLAAIGNGIIGFAQHFEFSPLFPLWVDTSPGGEVFGNLRQRNQFATLMNVGLAILLFSVYVLDIDYQRPKRWWCDSESHFVRVVAILTILGSVLLVSGIVLSRSRTGIAQLLVVCTLLLWWYRTTIRRSLWMVCGLLVSYPLLGILLTSGSNFTIVHRLTADLGCSSRKVLWSNVLDLIAQKPWFGWGWGELDYAHYAHLYGGERFCAILDNAHNLPLHLAVELGVPVALLLCGVVVWAVLRARPWRETEPARQLAWTVLALIGLHSMLEYPLWYGPFAMAVVLCIAMLWRSEPLPGSVSRPNRRLVHVLRPVVAIIIIASIAYVGWDYARISQLYLAPEDRSATYREDTLEKVSGSWLFRSQVEFADLTLTPLTRDNAASQNAMALRLLHYSPEPRVIEKVVESAVLLGRDDQALWYLERYRAAFPEDHAKWVAANAMPGLVPVPAR